MNKGEKIDVKQVSCREVDANYILNILRSNISIFWSWGSNNLIDLNGKGLRLTVSGHHFKGHIYIVLNGADLFDIYYCSNHGTIKDVHENIYFDQLSEVIDNKIERIDDYKD